MTELTDGDFRGRSDVPCKGAGRSQGVSLLSGHSAHIVLVLFLHPDALRYLQVV